MNVTTNITNLLIVVQWDLVDDFLHTTYTVTWTDEGDLHEVATIEEQTSYTITGLALDTVYNITYYAANMCGDGPDFTTSVSLSTDTTSTTSTISPTVTASTNPMTITSTANFSSTNRSITALINSSTTNNLMATKISITTTSTNFDISFITTLGTTTDVTTLAVATTTTSILTNMTNSGFTMTYPSTIITSTLSTVNPTNANIVDETSKISSTGNMLMNTIVYVCSYNDLRGLSVVSNTLNL